MSDIVDLSLSDDKASVSPTLAENNHNGHSKIYRGRCRVIRVRTASPSNAITTLPPSQPLGEVGVGNIDFKSNTIVKDMDDEFALIKPVIMVCITININYSFDRMIKYDISMNWDHETARIVHVTIDVLDVIDINRYCQFT
jgi:hypothetical protein